MRYKRIHFGTKFFGPCVMSALHVWLWLLLFIFQNTSHVFIAAEPGYLDFDNLPETNFSCAGKVIGGYYADLETDCQMFHVCTIGQLEEPMDIKFLCLNGTVFDQETRVCERVDEVDCSKSEKFYSLNLELYGNTAPPIIKAESIKNVDDDADIDEDEEYDELDDVYEDPTSTQKTSTTSSTTTSTSTTTTTTTQPTTTTRRYYTTPKMTYYQTTVQNYKTHDESDDEDIYDIIEDSVDKEISNKTSEMPKYQYNNYNTNYQIPKLPASLGQNNNLNHFGILSNRPDTNKEMDENSQIFSPQEFIYHHNKHELAQKTPAISFQQHSYSSNGQNSHVTVTTHIGREKFNQETSKQQNNKNEDKNRMYYSSSTPQSITSGYAAKSPVNNYQQYNMQKRIPLIPPSVQIQAPTGHPGLAAPKLQKEPIFFTFHRPQLTPQGFKLSQPSRTNQKLNQLTIKNNQNYQPSERHEISIEKDYELEKLTDDFPYISSDFAQYHYDQKRSQETIKHEVSTSTEKSVNIKTTFTTPYYSWATRNNNYTKGLPSVIITASASVSDSNGKKLNYSVGNIVHEVKPLTPTNYDDYKESDVPLDPFFLDVPKIKKGRSKRSNKKKKGNHKRKKRQTIIKVYKYDVASKAEGLISRDLPVVNKKDDHALLENLKETPPNPWIPPDYVDDNYEPITYNQTNIPKLDEFVEKTQVSKSSDIPIPTQATFTNVKSKNGVSQNIGNFNNNNNNNKLPDYNNFITESDIGKTSLDIGKLETTTLAYKSANSSKVQETKKYQLISVSVVNLNEKHTDNTKYSCRGKSYYKLYPDKINCRTFHICMPGENSNQVLDVLFICDLGTYFNYKAMICAADKPNDCE